MADMTPNPLPEQLLDYGPLKGGLVRMMDRYRDEGTMTGNPDADIFLRTYPNALLLGMLFDQRVRAEYAFTGPVRMFDRLKHLDMRKISSMSDERRREIFAVKPAVHRFTNKMADMTGAVAKVVSEEYGGDAANLWNDDAPFEEIEKRLRNLPGFGPQKAYKMKFALHYFGYRDFSSEEIEA